MNARLTPFNAEGSVKAPPSKSMAHRLLICAALCAERTRVLIAGSNEDIDATVSCLERLGACIAREDDALEVRSPVENAQHAALNCGESGSTLRFLLPVAAALGGASFSGRGRLPDRPLAPLMDQMRAHGASFSAQRLPFSVSALTRGGCFTLPCDVSSQFVSGLLLAAPLLKEDVSVMISGPLQSEAYVRMTMAAMARFSVRVARTDGGFFVPGGQMYCSPRVCAVQGDWSGAAFPLALGALGGDVRVTGLEEESAQGDREILPLLEKMGARVSFEDGAARVRHERPLSAIQTDVSGIPDLVPVLAALLMHARGVSRLGNAARLRLKESDRLSTTRNMVLSLGGKARIEDDSLIIEGVERAAGGEVCGANDHRIVMAAAVAASACAGPSRVTCAESARKSYPGFFQDYYALGGNAHVVDAWE